MAAADGWPAFADPAGLVADPATGEPAALGPGGAGRRVALEEAALREWVGGVVDLWLRAGVAAQARALPPPPSLHSAVCEASGMRVDLWLRAGVAAQARMLV
jgi:hypothetical protein